jgi:DNA-binding IclR family transcriptional regulator
MIFAGLQPDQLDRWIARTDLRPLTPKSITDPRILKQEFDEIRLKGVAFDDGEFDPELRCIAVPVRDFSGQMIGAMGVSGPIWRLSMQALQSRARVVQSAADRLSAEFGADISQKASTRPQREDIK